MPYATHPSSVHSHIPAKPPRSTSRRVFKVIKYFVLLLLALIILAVAAVVFLPQGWLQRMAGSNGSDALGRSFSIDGPIHIGWDWTVPSVHLEQVHLGNKPGEKDPYMVSIDQIDFHIAIWKLLEGQLNIPDIKLVKPQIFLAKDADGSNNWTLPTMSKANAASTAALPSKRSNFPIIGTLAIQDGSLNYRDATKNLDLTLAIDDAKGDDDVKGEGSFQLSGQGKLQDKTFKINATAGSLSMLRNTDKDYPLDLKLEMGNTLIAVKGTFQDPVQLKGIDTHFEVKGENMADLYYLTVIPLPPTPAYQLTGHLTKDGNVWGVGELKGAIGQSDIEGTAHYDVSGDRGYLTADLVSELLRVADLGPLIGIKPGEQQKAVPEKDKKLLPDVPINLDRLRSADMDVALDVKRFEQPGLPLENLNVHVDLKNGVLKIDPLSVGIAGGKVAGAMVLDGSKPTPNVSIDLTLQKLQLKPFFKDSRFAAFSEGHFNGAFKIDGNGNTLAKVLGDGNGHITFVMSGGEVSKLIIDAAGLDVGKATVALLGSDERTPIRCAIGDFGLKNGALNSDILVVDTGASNINGTANINLKDETMDVSVEGHPKSPSISARTPIVVTGKLSSPSVGLDPKEIGARGAAAAGLSLVLTPLAAIIPFIDLGLGDDSDCKALIDKARTNSDATPPSPASTATP